MKPQPYRVTQDGSIRSEYNTDRTFKANAWNTYAEALVAKHQIELDDLYFFETGWTSSVPELRIERF